MCYLVAGCLSAPTDIPSQGCCLVLLGLNHHSAAACICALSLMHCCAAAAGNICCANSPALQLEAAHMCYLVAGCVPAPIDAG
jgi:hypothetical protein